jgi:hypothetical protein
VSGITNIYYWTYFLFFVFHCISASIKSLSAVGPVPYVAYALEYRPQPSQPPSVDPTSGASSTDGADRMASETLNILPLVLMCPEDASITFCSTLCNAVYLLIEYFFCDLNVEPIDKDMNIVKYAYHYRVVAVQASLFIMYVQALYSRVLNRCKY